MLSGRKFFVPDAHTADYAIVAARTSEGEDAREGITLFVVPMKQGGVSVTSHATMALEKQSQVDFDEVLVSADAVLGSVDGGWSALERALERAATAKGLEMVGGRRSGVGDDVGVFEGQGAVRASCRHVPGVAAPLREHGYRR